MKCAPWLEWPMARRDSNHVALPAFPHPRLVFVAFPTTLHVNIQISRRYYIHPADTFTDKTCLMPQPQAEFSAEQQCWEAPVVFTGDLNATKFQQVQSPTTWTVLQQDCPNHLGLW